MTHEDRLKEIKEHPENHRHPNTDTLMSCSMINGAISLMLLDAHAGTHGTNGGVKCDVAEGPCACGAWHNP